MAAQIQIAKSRFMLMKYEESKHPRDDNGMWTATGVSVSRLSDGSSKSKPDHFGDAKFRNVTGSLPKLGADRNPRVAAIIAAEEEKKKEVKIAQLANLALTLVDLSQTTMGVVNNPNKFVELNPVLGKYPIGSSVNAFFAAQILGQAMLAFLPPQVRIPLSVLDFVNRLPAVVGNAAIGLK